jgi:hypothetical protein
MRRLRQFFALASLTASEALRQPICLVLTITCVLLTAFIPLLALHNFGEEGRLARDSGLAFQWVFGLLITGYCASVSLSRELRSGTAATVLSKPVGRETLFLAKYAGICVVVLAFSICTIPATLMAERISEHFLSTGQLTGYITDHHTGLRLILAPLAACALAGILNYRFRKPFAFTAFALLVLAILVAFFATAWFDRGGHFTGAFHPEYNARILPAGLLITMALMVFAAIALTVSVHADVGATLSVCGLLLLAGLLSEHLFGGRTRVPGASILYRLLPDWQHFWMADALRSNGAIPAGYLAESGGYALLAAAGVLLIGVALFRHADVK